jgi:hypothetical protein
VINIDEQPTFIWEEFINEPSWTRKGTDRIRIAKYAAWQQVVSFIMDIAFEDQLMDVLTPEEANYLYIADIELRQPDGFPIHEEMKEATIELE